MSEATAGWFPSFDLGHLPLPWRRDVRRRVHAGAERVTPKAARVMPWRRIAAATMGMLLLSLIVWGVMALRDPAVLPIKRVAVQGPFLRVDADQVRQAISTYTRGSFFTVNVVQLQQAVQGLPWVQEVAVRRLWPDTLRVTVTERTALALWGTGGLVSTQGAVYAPAPASYPARLPTLSGPEHSEYTVAGAYGEMTQILAPLGVHIARLTLDSRRAWDVTLDNGVEFVLGRGDYAARLRRFVLHYRQALGERVQAVARVDMRYPNGYTVAWRPGLRAK